MRRRTVRADAQEQNTGAGYPVRVVRSEQAQARQPMRIAVRAFIAVALVLGIAAMHTMLGTSMSARMPPGTHASVTAEMSIGMDAAAMGGSLAGLRAVVATSDQASVSSEGMAHDAMHACLFLLAAIVLALLAGPTAWGRDRPIAAPIATRRRRRRELLGIGRVLALRVLRI